MSKGWLRRKGARGRKGKGGVYEEEEEEKVILIAEEREEGEWFRTSIQGRRQEGTSNLFPGFHSQEGAHGDR